MARLLMLTLLCSTLMGCELIADFDRSKIPDDHPGRDGGGLQDAAVFDAVDASAVDDAGPDPEEDAGGGDDDAG